MRQNLTVSQYTGTLINSLLIGITLVVVSPISFAQAPDAGSITNQQQPRNPRIERLPAPDSKETEQLITDKQGPTVKVNSIRLSGGESLEDIKVLQTLVADAIGQELSFAQLQQIAERVSRHLKAKGWLLANAYLPKQDVTEGNIEIAISVGKIEDDQLGHGILIQRDEGTRLKEHNIHQRMRQVIGDAGSVQKADLERALLLLDDLPGINARSTLEKGSQPGTSRLGVAVNEGRLIDGSFSIDDYGNRYTGPWRGNLAVNINDPFGWGDRLTLSGIGAENLGQGFASYSVPLGTNGLIANGHYSHLNYLVGREFTNLESKGTAEYSGGGLSYPLIRSRAFSLWGSADYTHKNLRDESLAVVTDHRFLDNGTVGLNTQSLDGFFGGGLTQASFSSLFGNVDLSAIAADLASDQATAKTHGRYQKFNLSLVRLQKLSERFSFYSAAYGQVADRNLNSAEKFILGGPYGVRAYSVGEGIGDNGWVSNFELRYDIPVASNLGALQLVSFFDTGYVTQHQQRWQNDVISLTGRNEYSLSGSGIGLNWSKDQRYAIRTNWSHTIGGNPGRTTHNLDSDGKADSNRFWLQAIVSF
jgi:hemolysin activation/secretion protein